MKLLIYIIILYTINNICYADIFHTCTYSMPDTSISASQASKNLLDQISSDPSINLQKLYKLYLPLDDFNIFYRLQQLDYLVNIRNTLKTNDIQSLALSNLLGVLIVNEAFGIIIDYKTTYQDKNKQFYAPQSSKSDLFKFLLNILYKNALVSSENRPYIMELCGLKDDVDKEYRTVINNAIKLEREKHKSRWGSNVLAMQKASGIDHSRSNILLSLFNQATKKWESVVKEKMTFDSICWWVASDILVQNAFNLSVKYSSDLSIKYETKFTDNLLIHYNEDTIESLAASSCEMDADSIVSKLFLY